MSVTDRPKLQHEEAFEKANRVRLRRAAEGRKVKAATQDEGLRMVAELISCTPPPSWAKNLEVAAAIKWVHRWQATRVRRLLAPLYIGENRRLGELTERERERLSRALLKQQQDEATHPAAACAWWGRP